MMAMFRLVLFQLAIHVLCTKNTLRKRAAEIQAVSDARKSLRSTSSPASAASEAFNAARADLSPLADWMKDLRRQGTPSTVQLQKGAAAAFSTTGGTTESML